MFGETPQNAASGPPKAFRPKDNNIFGNSGQEAAKPTAKPVPAEVPVNEPEPETRKQT